ncbi:MAG: peroxidase family protein [Planctomycetota bacterium]
MPLFFNSGRRKKRQQSHKAKRQSLRRRLRSEPLESRQLLAGDYFHNHSMPEDVDNSGEVTARDALMIINAMGRGNFDESMFTDVNNDGHRSANDALRVINRINRGRQDPPPGATDEVRTIDGTGNNVENPDFGSAHVELLRVGEADYAGGVSEPAGADRPSAREISNLLSAADPEGTANDRGLSAFVFMWGQFLDHDIDLSEAPSEESDQVSFDIQVPTGDPLFDPFGTGQVTIPLTRSEFAEGTGTSADSPAEQLNIITAWIDGSQVYGSDQETADALREFAGGRMLITDDGLLPTDEDGNLLAGDIRAAENIALTSMHALFVREHNRLADEIAAGNPELNDEEIYQQAREIVIAELQAITYNEFLPALLGDRAISDYDGYDATVDPGIANEFSTAAFRFGHSTLTDEIGFVGSDGLDVQEAVSLADAFFNPSMLEETGIDSVLKYGSSIVSQEIDLQVVDSLRNFLFGPPGAGGLDLVSLNIQRGRDHGLDDYNGTRVAYGLEAFESFEELTSDVELQQNLETLYGDVNNIDLWVGLLAEDHARDGSLGELASTIIVDQFERLRDGDRFWYENTMDRGQVRMINRTSLADIIERNTNVTSLQDNVFFFAPEVSGTVVALDQSEGSSDRSRGGGDKTEPMEGMVVQLIDENGVVVDTTLTDQDGDYEFDSLTETGAFQVALVLEDGMQVDGNATLDVLVASGDSRLRGYDFEVIV